MTSTHTKDIHDALWPDTANAPSRILACRSCGKKNRVNVSVAVFEPESCECGACRKPLFIKANEPLTAISSTAYEHSLDRKSLQALKAVPGFAELTRWVLAGTGERQLTLLARSTSIECGPQQFPELLALMDRAAVLLDIPYRPKLFLAESPFMNAMTFGAQEPLIIVFASLLDSMDDLQVQAVLAHELGHLHADHVVYRTMAELMMLGGQIFGGVAGRLLTIPLRKALSLWSRCAELTADRAGLLGTRDVPTSLDTLMVLAGSRRPGISSRTKLSMPAFIRQARALAEQEQQSLVDSIMSTLMTMNASHPFVAWRVMHLLEWIEHGNYLDILAGDYGRVVRGKAEASVAEAVPA